MDLIREENRKADSKVSSSGQDSTFKPSTETIEPKKVEKSLVETVLETNNDEKVAETTIEFKQEEKNLSQRADEALKFIAAAENGGKYMNHFYSFLIADFRYYASGFFFFT